MVVAAAVITATGVLVKLVSTKARSAEQWMDFEVR